MQKIIKLLCFIVAIIIIAWCVVINIKQPAVKGQVDKQEVFDGDLLIINVGNNSAKEISSNTVRNLTVAHFDEKKNRYYIVAISPRITSDNIPIADYCNDGVKAMMGKISKITDYRIKKYVIVNDALLYKIVSSIGWLHKNIWEKDISYINEKQEELSEQLSLSDKVERINKSGYQKLNPLQSISYAEINIEGGMYNDLHFRNIIDTVLSYLSRYSDKDFKQIIDILETGKNNLTDIEWFKVRNKLHSFNRFGTGVLNESSDKIEY